MAVVAEAVAQEAVAEVRAVVVAEDADTKPGNSNNYFRPIDKTIMGWPFL